MAPHARARYPDEQIIALGRAGRTSNELAKEVEPSEQKIRNWIFQAEADRGDRSGVLTTGEREELGNRAREQPILGEFEHSHRLLACDARNIDQELIERVPRLAILDERLY